MVEELTHTRIVRPSSADCAMQTEGAARVVTGRHFDHSVSAFFFLERERERGYQRIFFAPICVFVLIFDYIPFQYKNG